MIGIFGGTFDPVHFGHLRPALEVYEALSLDEVRLIPCRLPPHREYPQASARDRLAMLRLAVEGQPGLRIDDRELRRDGPSYMIDTLQGLHSDFPQTPLCLILGLDAFMGLPSWHRWEAILSLAHIVVVHRPGFDAERLQQSAELERLWRDHHVDRSEALHASLAGKVYFQIVTALDISATMLRQALSTGHSIRYLLPERVQDYIRQRNLYG